MSLLSLSTSAAYGIGLPVRTICAVPPNLLVENDETDHSLVHRFLIPTCSSVSSNRLYCLDYIESNNTIECSSLWEHNQEVLSISATRYGPKQDILVSTIHAVSDQMNKISATLFSVEETDTGTGGGLFTVLSLPLGSSCVFWPPPGDKDSDCAFVSPNRVARDFAFVCDDELCTASLAISGVLSIVDRVKLPPLLKNPAGPLLLPCGSWDPNNFSKLIVVYLHYIMLIDLPRTKDSLHGLELLTISNAISDIAVTVVDVGSLHLGGIRCATHLLCRAHTLLTCSDGGDIVFWNKNKLSLDSEKGILCKIMNLHNYGISTICPNPFEEHLILSCCIDGFCRLTELSAENVIFESSDSENCYLENKVISTAEVTGFQGTAQSCCWSSQSPWVFACVGYNGTVVMQGISNDTKTDIILR